MFPLPGAQVQSLVRELRSHTHKKRIRSILVSEWFSGPSKGTKFPELWRQGEHPKIWTYFPLHLHWPSSCQEQRLHLQIPSKQTQYCFMNWLLLWGAHKCIWGEASRVSQGTAVLWDWRDSTKEWMSWRRQWFRQRTAAEITRKLEKQKKHLKKEKKQLAATALTSSENSSSAEKECEEGQRCWDLAESPESWLQHTPIPWASVFCPWLPPRSVRPRMKKK